jgi:hypothetical protein
MALSHLVVALGLPGGSRRCLPAVRRFELHPCAPGFREADRDGLLGRSRTMLTFSHMVHFLTHEFSSLRARRFSLAGIRTSAFDGFVFRHTNLRLQPSATARGKGIEGFL